MPEPKRQRRGRCPMPTFSARLEEAPPWAREAAELSPAISASGWPEALELTLGSISTAATEKALRFDGATTKSGRDEFAHPVPGGWELLMRLARQSRARRQERLITWPGSALMGVDFLAGRAVPVEAWRPLLCIRRSWRTTAGAAQVTRPHRFHDVRARYITEVAKVASSATTQEAARHRRRGHHGARYTAIASAEVAKALKGVPRPNIWGQSSAVKKR